MSKDSKQEISVEEGNRLIFFFMGAREMSSHTNPKGIKTILSAQLDDLYVKDFERELKYHSSWDWLMPVVEKIEGTCHEHHGYFGVYISANTCTIQATKLRTDQPLASPPHYYDEQISGTKIKATWLAVIQFIQWYQSQAKAERFLNKQI